ncbi:MAG: hypothetical protein JXA25_15165 [Anaerolineales bacterium]|nr:hypothetical protein [Anaerolineales bacterium]
MGTQRRDFDDSMDRLISRSMKEWAGTQKVNPGVRQQLLVRAASRRGRRRFSVGILLSYLILMRAFFRDAHMDAIEAIRLLRVPGGVGYEYKRRSLSEANRTLAHNFLPVSMTIFVFS